MLVLLGRKMPDRIGNVKVSDLYCIDYFYICDETSKDTLEIPLEFGLRRRAGLDDWWFGSTVNAFYINFVKP